MRAGASLEQWLDWIASIHHKEIDLGLERVKTVWQALGGVQPTCPVIIVGGTNGKGSCVATMEKIYRSQGYRVGVFTSPILWRHNEMVRLHGEAVAEHFFCEAYEKIEIARQGLSLTPFEYHTLAALDIFRRHALDVWIVEVGLGGRLDAVNILDADVAVVTSIDLDHQALLGNTRELIGQEKAGIFRPQKPAVYGDFDPPQSLLRHARKLSVPLFKQGKEFTYTVEAKAWSWQSASRQYTGLAFSQLALQNIATALMAIDLLQPRLPVAEAAIAQAIKTVQLPGRIERISQPRKYILDVAHNPAAVAFLAQQIEKIPRAVFSMLNDKDLRGSIRQIKDKLSAWYVAPLRAKRAASEEKLRAAFDAEAISAVKFYASITDAYHAALRDSAVDEEILVFGSFYTVGEVRRLILS